MHKKIWLAYSMGVQNFYGKWPHPLLCGVVCGAHVEELQ